MPDVMEFKPGNYKFIVSPGGPFSSGVTPMPSFALRRVRFARPISMADGFAFIKAHLEREGRPVTALAACELRSPAAMTGDQFQAFNGEYQRFTHGAARQATSIRWRAAILRRSPKCRAKRCSSPSPIRCPKPMRQATS